MITDHIRNRHLYYSLGERYRKVLDFLAAYNPKEAIKVDIPLDGDEVFVKVRVMHTKPVEECSFEAHKEYADIHFVAEGTEKIGYADAHSLTQISFNADKDLSLLSGSGEYITLRRGYFLIAFPDDAHMPCVYAGERSGLTKLVVKIKLNTQTV